MHVILSEAQIEWLKIVVKYRVADEQAEMQELLPSGRLAAINRCQERINMWASILEALNCVEVES